MYIIAFTNLSNEWTCGPFTSEDQADDWLLSHGYLPAEPWGWWDGYAMAHVKMLFDPSTPESDMAGHPVIYNTRDPLYGEAHERGCGCVICDPCEDTLDDPIEQHVAERRYDTEAMYAANVAYEDRVNPAVWDQAVANDSNAWCDACGRMRAYCACNGRL